MLLLFGKNLLPHETPVCSSLRNTFAGKRQPGFLYPVSLCVKPAECSFRLVSDRFFARITCPFATSLHLLLLSLASLNPGLFSCSFQHLQNPASSWQDFL